MTRTRSTAAAIAAIAILLTLLPAAAGAAGGTVRIDPGGSPSRAAAYWTKERMRAAEPVPVELSAAAPEAGRSVPESGPPTYVEPVAPRSAGGAQIRSGSVAGAKRSSSVATAVANPSKRKVRSHGKVFFTIIGGDNPGNYVCSGTAVNSRNKSLVLTAGHCVWDHEYGGGKASNFVFVPAYHAGEAPFGKWAAKSLATTKRWKRKGNLHYDIGAAVVRRDDRGRRLQRVVGARGIGFDQRRHLTYTAFGYPQQLPFDGSTEFRCKGPSLGVDVPGGKGPSTIKFACDMTAGSSGGGWIARGKTLVSVTSYSYDSQPGFLYGPYFSSTAKSLYKKMRGK